MFKRHYGTCIVCGPEITTLIVVKKGLCRKHNQERKNLVKPPKIRKPKIFKPIVHKTGQCMDCEIGDFKILVAKNICHYHNQKRKNEEKPKKAQKPRVIKNKVLRHGQCIDCTPDTISVLAVQHLCHKHNEARKKEIKSKRVVKLVNNAEKKKSIKYLIGELDRIFSLYIRKRDSNKDGYGKCVTCPTIKHYTKMDCGHFITRGVMAIRWHPFNCALQCKSCNGFAGGEQDIFSKEINKRWGQNTSETFQIKRHFSKKLERFTLELLIKEYTEKITQLDAR